MSERKKIGPIRQLSLQTDFHPRPILKKQLSVEHLNQPEEQKNIRHIGSAKENKFERPRPIKVAWAENKQTSKEDVSKYQFGDSVEVKKCKEFKRPSAIKLKNQNSVETESILYSRQDLVERFRNAWKFREETKQNLDIFLNNGIQKTEEKAENTIPIPKTATKTINMTANSIESEVTYVPSNKNSCRTNISVKIPNVCTNFKNIQDTSQPDSLDPKISQVINKESKQTDVINKENNGRPLTATAKRESFQKRTNSAFNDNITSITKEFRPPLLRTQSVPVKSDGNKLKFISTKRRLKSARKKCKEEANSCEENDVNAKNSLKKGSRCKSAPGGELITMVSLVSPAGSDTEEQAEVKKVEVKKEINKNANNELVKTGLLRKSVKSVSFQQSTIHCVRSFSASFPSRRISAFLPEREKRAPVESLTSGGDTRAPKRRLVGTVSVREHAEMCEQNLDSSKEDVTDDLVSKSSFEIPETPKQPLGITEANIHLLNKNAEQPNINVQETKEDQEVKTKEETPEEEKDPGLPKFESNKERECWIMYKKMSDKGLPVSFDTILRGMLTPTEYRLVRKEIKTETS